MLEAGQFRIIPLARLTMSLLPFGQNIRTTPLTGFHPVMHNQWDTFWHLRTSFCRGGHGIRLQPAQPWQLQRF
jgi:hypothetical protein